jgi:hypothetical protein
MLLTVLRVLGHEEEEAIRMILDVRPEADFPPLYLASLDEFMQEFEALREFDAATVQKQNARA